MTLGRRRYFTEALNDSTLAENVRDAWLRVVPTTREYESFRWLPRLE